MNEEIKRILIRKVVSEITSKVVLAIPFFGWPIVNQIFVAIAYKYVMKFFSEADLHGISITVNFKVESQKLKYEESVKNLKKVVMDTDKTKEEVEKAKNEFENSLRDLISFK